MTYCYFACGQESDNSVFPQKHTIRLHYYPSGLVTGDIAIGIEHSLKKRFAHELSVNIKLFQPKLYYYDQGFRSDYLFKYFLITKKRFMLSVNLGLEYKDIQFKNKLIDYRYGDLANNQSSIIYQTIREDRRQIEYGVGLGFSFIYRLSQRFSLGSDIGLNRVKYKVRYRYKELVYRQPYLLNNYPIVPSEYQGKMIPALGGLLRLKISYVLN